MDDHEIVSPSRILRAGESEGASAGAGQGLSPDHGGGAAPERRVALVDLLDRILAGGVVATGDIELSIADVPMVRISLRAVIASVSSLANEKTSELIGDRSHEARGQ